MLTIGGSLCNVERDENDCRAKGVGDGVDAVGQQGERMADDAGDQLDDAQRKIHEETDGGDAAGRGVQFID
jgi:hypothetical protein